MNINTFKKPKNLKHSALIWTVALLTLLVIFFIAYLIWSWVELSDKPIPVDLLESSYWTSLDESDTLTISGEYISCKLSGKRYLFKRGDMAVIGNVVELENSIYTLRFVYLEGGRIYNDYFNVMLYLTEAKNAKD